MNILKNRKQKQKKSLSINRQVMLIFGGILVVMILLLVLINGRFLLPYYLADKEKQFVEIYNRLNTEEADNALTEDDFSRNLLEEIETNNMTFMVVGKDDSGTITNVRNYDVLMKDMLAYSMNVEINEEAVIDSTDDYVIYRSTDKMNGIIYLEMVGSLKEGSLFILRSPLESIHESVRITNRFFLMVGGIMIVLAVISAWFFSKMITEPIKELADLSKKMANLDFDAKYSGEGSKEIVELGDSFNQMSKKLERAISELKTANNKLQIDIEKKDQLEQMRTEFLGNVSHELKTPIALIQGYAEGLKEGISEDPESREFYCDVIMDEADKMNHMVRNLLTLNQLESGAEQVVFERFDLAELTDNVLQSMEIMNPGDVKIMYSPERPVFVWADEMKIEHVLRNYISNAYNHVSGDQYKYIEVKIQKDEEHHLARVSVFNTGKPIPKEDVDRIWDKFYKVDKAHTREYGGNGIGLSIVKASMESMHREFGVRNYENGVEFWFNVDMKNE